jgi:hypothetical protein
MKKPSALPDPISELCPTIGGNAVFLRTFSWSKFCKLFNGKLSCRRSVPLGAGCKKQQSGPLRLQSPSFAFADTPKRRYAETASFVVEAPPRYVLCASVVNFGCSVPSLPPLRPSMGRLIRGGLLWRERLRREASGAQQAQRRQSDLRTKAASQRTNSSSRLLW